MPKRDNTSWGGVADWYHDHLEKSDDTYQRTVILPNLLRLLALKKGEKVLDLACGSGFFSRALAEAGAQVLGVDISPELIKLAQEKPQANLRYQVASADNLARATKGDFAKVICVLALQNISDIKKVFSEIKQVLRPGGQLFLVLNHPTFRIPGASAWGFDEVSQVQYRRLEAYMSERKAKIEMHPGSAPAVATLSFHRPLQTYFKLLANTGFAVTRLEEWISPKVSEAGPRAAPENRARHEFPLFLYLEAKLL